MIQPEAIIKYLFQCASWKDIMHTDLQSAPEEQIHFLPTMIAEINGR